MNTRKPTERQVLGAESRTAILDAAEALMARRGFIGTSISALQAECGLPASSIYWHFESKEGVLAAVMERGANNFFAKVDSIRFPPGTLGRDCLRAQLAGASVAIEQNTDFLRLFVLLMLTGKAVKAVQRVRNEGRSRLHRLLATAYPGRDGSPDESLADELADVLLAMFDGVFLAIQNDPRLRYAQLLEQVADAIALLAATRIRPRTRSDRVARPG
jgi:AcrR family transcriptional regulator